MTQDPKTQVTITYSTMGMATTGGNISLSAGLNLNAPAGVTSHARGKRPRHLRVVRD